MEEKVFFSKVQFNEYRVDETESALLINLVEGTLAYQVYTHNKNGKAPAITGVMTEQFMGMTLENKIAEPAVRMKNGKTGFKSVLIKDDNKDSYVKFSYTYKFTDDEMKELLSYCNAKDFEPYRNRKMSMQDEGYIGYRDEVDVCFTGVTDSYIPIIKLPMGYYYDEKHIWPSEKLYRYVIQKYMMGDNLRGWATRYGGFSLIFGGFGKR